VADDRYYLQDSRGYVGNDMLFWAIDGKGYTTDMRNAHVYTKAEAVAQHEQRVTDIPWPKSYIDERTRPAVDMQHVKRGDALAGTGIELRKPPRKQPACEQAEAFRAGVEIGRAAALASRPAEVDEPQQILNSMTHTARRDHLCAFCGVTVRTGERYVRAQSPGGAQAKKAFHSRCYEGLIKSTEQNHGQT
jgi:hypothetical protein